MLSDFLMDVLLLHQGRSVDETAIIMHWLQLSGATEIRDWHSFLLGHVKPGDYVFPHNARDIMADGLARRLRMIETLHPALLNDQFNMDLSRRHGVIFLATKDRVAKIGKEGDQFLRRWINTGLYVGARQAWELYIARLALCLENASEIRTLVETEAIPDFSERIGGLLAGIFTVNSFMAA